jgi:hypothetical protein
LREHRRRRVGLVSLALVLGLGVAGPAEGQGCGRAVVVALPGVTWADVQRVRPPELLAAMRAGSAGSVSVRVFSATSDYGSGFATLGAGTRLAAAPAHRATSRPGPGLGRVAQVRGLGAMRRLAEQAGYDATPGALAGDLEVPVAAVGNGRLGADADAFGDWILLAAMDPSGTVPHAVTGDALVRAERGAPFGISTRERRAAQAVAGALDLRCGLTFVTEGDLIRAEQEALRREKSVPRSFDDALQKADRLIGVIRSRLDRAVDTLVIVTPTGPAASGVAHLGVAIAEGPGFPPGTSLASASTRRRGTVTLPDVAPTILDHFRQVDRGMVGRPWSSEEGPHRLDAAVALDREAVFLDAATSGVVRVLIGVQALVYGAAVAAFSARLRARARPWLEGGGLAIAAWPLATYALGMVDGYTLGFLAWVLLLAAVDAALVAAVWMLTSQPLRRLMWLSLATVVVLLLDLAAGAELQMNTVLGYSPIVGGRFSGIGNLGFAVLAASAICSGALVVHASGGARGALAAVVALFVVVIVADGAPALGSDVGGTLALVPGLGLASVLLWGRRVDLKLSLAFAAAALVVVAVFLTFDLTRPPEARTHLARLYESVAERGGDVLVGAIERKAAANLRLLTRSVWAIPVLPALAVLGWLLLRPPGMWRGLRRRYPAPAAGLVAGSATAVLGFAVNDSGIGIPSVMLLFLVPLALLLRIDGERREGA